MLLVDGEGRKRQKTEELTREGLYGGRLVTGRLPGVLNKKTRMAQQILREAQEEVVRGVIEMTKERIPSADSCSACGRGGHGACPLCECGRRRPEDTRIRASAEVMDRGGTPRVTQVENIEKPDIAWMEYLSDAQIETLGRWIDEARERMPINEPPVEQDQETVN